MRRLASMAVNYFQLVGSPGTIMAPTFVMLGRPLKFVGAPRQMHVSHLKNLLECPLAWYAKLFVAYVPGLNRSVTQSQVRTAFPWPRSSPRFLPSDGRRALQQSTDDPRAA
jgi:hypothetical protein